MNGYQPNLIFNLMETRNTNKGINGLYNRYINKLIAFVGCY